MSVHWLDVAHAADHVGYADALSEDRQKARAAQKAFRKWATRHGVPCGHRGRCQVYLPADLDQALGGAHLVAAQTRRQSVHGHLKAS